MEQYVLLELATDLGYELAMSGAETFRVEESVSRILAAYGINAEVFAIPNYLIVSTSGQDSEPITRMRRIGFHGNDLDNVERLSALSRALCSQTPPPAEARQWLDDLHKSHRAYPPSIQYLGYFLGASGFSLFFNGNWMDALCAGICGMLIGLVNSFTDRLKANPFFSTIASSFLMGLLAYIMGIIGLAPSPDAVIIGALMILVPGLLFTNSMRDFIYGDTNSGINRLIQVFLVAAAIALGTAGAWKLVAGLFSTPVSAVPINWSILSQCIFALVGCLGFSLVFNIYGGGLILCPLGGFLCWAVYDLVLLTGCSDIIAYFWGALFASVYSECMARIRKYPAISYLVVSIFPMIPGAGVYYTMNLAVRGEMEAFASKGMHTAAIAGIIAVGILLGSTVFRMYSDWKRRSTEKAKL